MRAMSELLIALLALTLARGTLGAPLPSIAQLFGWLTDEEVEETCRTDACINAAAKLTESMDESTDPCDNFYKFACNGWLQKRAIPRWTTIWSQFYELHESLDARLHALLSEGTKEDDEDAVTAIKMMYEACMDDERIEKKGVRPLLDLLDELGGWPLASEALGDIRWQDAAVLVTKKLGITPVLSVRVEVGLRNTSRNTISVDKPAPSTQAHSFMDNDFVSNYKAYFHKTVKYLRKKRKLPTPSEVRNQIRQTIEFELFLTVLTEKKYGKDRDMLGSNEVSIRRLQTWTDRVVSKTESRLDWKDYLQKLLEKGDSEINEDTPVFVYDWNFLKELLQLIEATPPETVVNYILWEVVKFLKRETNQKMREMEFEFRMSADGVEEDIPRWKECVQGTYILEFAVGYLYVKNFFSDEAKAKAIEIVENIRNEFREELSEATWIDEETKEKALEKADYMNQFIGYPDWYGNETALSRYYRGLKIGRDHFANVLAVRQFLTNNSLSQLGRGTSRDEWITGPAQINAFYDLARNSVIFPAGILQLPFFDKDQPDALNYGSIGSIIGHEITHAFDDQGHRADKFGNVNQWWTKETEMTYIRKSQCFVGSYSKFRFPTMEYRLSTDISVDGLLTLGENIADNGGLATSLRAYLKHSRGKQTKLPGLEKYSPEQLFYLGYATTWCEMMLDSTFLSNVLEDPHPPSIVRVTGTLVNSQHFAEVWGCPSDSKMNPSEKCRLW